MHLHLKVSEFVAAVRTYFWFATCVHTPLWGVHVSLVALGACALALGLRVHAEQREQDGAGLRNHKMVLLESRFVSHNSR